MKIFILLFVILAMFILSIAIGANNDQTVLFNYLVAQSEMRLSTLLAYLFGAGFVISWLISGVLYFRMRMRFNSAQRKLKKLQQQYDEQVAINNKTKLISSTVSSDTVRS